VYKCDVYLAATAHNSNILKGNAKRILEVIENPNTKTNLWSSSSLDPSIPPLILSASPEFDANDSFSGHESRSLACGCSRGRAADDSSLLIQANDQSLPEMQLSLGTTTQYNLHAGTQRRRH
jgi:hypothetical protein